MTIPDNFKNDPLRDETPVLIPVPKDPSEGKLTWRELKEFANQIDDQFLDNTVVVMDNELATEVDTCATLGDDNYYFPNQEYSTTEADWDPMMFDKTYDTFQECLADNQYSVAKAASPWLFTGL